MPVKNPAQYQSHNYNTTATLKWKTAIIDVINYICPFPSMSCQKVCCETSLLNETQTKHPFSCSGPVQKLNSGL